MTFDTIKIVKDDDRNHICIGGHRQDETRTHDGRIESLWFVSVSISPTGQGGTFKTVFEKNGWFENKPSLAELTMFWLQEEVKKITLLYAKICSMEH